MIAALIGIATVASGVAALAASGGNDADFLADLRKPMLLVKYAAPRPSGRRPLAAEDRANLLEAKKTMEEFLKSFSTFYPDPLTFLAPPLRSQFESGQDLYAKKFGAEKLIEVEIYDHSLPDKEQNELALYVVLTDTTEGIDSRQPTAFSFSKEGDRWLIAGIGREVGFR